MGREIELKLAVPRTKIGKAINLPWLRDLVRGEVTREKLSSVYFDTPKFELRDRGVALRVRHIGKKRVQTIKVENGGSGALGRGEWEEEIAGAAPDLSLAKGTALAPLATKKLRRKLRPVFETVIERTALPVHAGTSEIEIAVDRGYIKAGRRRDPISEIELELKGGDPAELARIAERLMHSLPVAYGARPKPDRGYALVAGKAAGPIPAADAALERDCSTADAFHVIALACLDHALGNERAVGAGDAEGVHQMRVGLRRLRAALSLFKPLIGSAETESIKAELTWLTEQLGPARDLDVLVTEGVDPLRDAAPAAEAGILTEDLRGERDRGLDRAKAAVGSDRYRSLGVKTALWIIDGGWARSRDEMIAALRARPAAEFAAERLGKRLRKILKKAARIESLDPRGRHKLRIAVKTLRYGATFFAGLFDGGGKHRAGVARFGKRLKELQGALGRLNDIVVHQRVAHRVAHEPSPKRADKALAMGFVTGHEQTEIAPCLIAVAKSAKQLAKIAPFWK
jgi:inorganic triphosphatase YgiF